MPRSTRVARLLALSGYFGLFLLLTAWYAWLAPSARFPVALTLLVMVSPLLFPLRGLLLGRPYTHAWTSLLALLYFAHGVGEAYANPREGLYAGLEILFSLTLFWGAVLFARWRGRELRDAAQTDGNAS